MNESAFVDMKEITKEEVKSIPLTMDSLVWYDVPDSRFQVMTNCSGELFVRFKSYSNGDKEVRLTPSQRGFKITDWNTPGKLTLNGEIQVV